MNNNLSLLTAVMTILTSGTATTYLTELLKMPWIKIPAEKFKRTTAAVMSVITSAIALLIQGVSFGGDHWIVTAGVVAGTFVISARIYQTALASLPRNQ